jgi:hypothetical protein
MQVHAIALPAPPGARPHRADAGAAAIKKYHHRASAHSSRDLLQFTRFDQGMELTGKCQAPLKTILTILLL